MFVSIICVLCLVVAVVFNCEYFAGCDGVVLVALCFGFDLFLLIVCLLFYC